MKTQEMTFDEIYEDYNYIHNTTDDLDCYQTKVIMNGYKDNMWKNSQILKVKTLAFKGKQRITPIALCTASFTTTVFLGKGAESLITWLAQMI